MERETPYGGDRFEIQWALFDLWSLTQIKMNKKDLDSAIDSCFKNRNQEFSIERLDEIFKNDFFIRNMVRIAEANFNQLKLPPIKNMMDEIFNFIKYPRTILNCYHSNKRTIKNVVL